MDTVRKHAHLLKVGDVVLFGVVDLGCVVDTMDSWDSGVMLRIFDLTSGEVYEWWFSAFDELNVLA